MIGEATSANIAGKGASATFRLLHSPVAGITHGRPEGLGCGGPKTWQDLDAYRGRYLGVLAQLRTTLLDDQVKLNDPGASQYIIDTLAKDGWNGLLRYYEGEVWRLRNSNMMGDEARAAQGYAAAIQYPDAPPDAWRWHGIMLLKQGRRGEAKAASPLSPAIA